MDTFLCKGPGWWHVASEELERCKVEAFAAREAGTIEFAFAFLGGVDAEQKLGHVGMENDYFGKTWQEPLLKTHRLGYIQVCGEPFR